MLFNTFGNTTKKTLLLVHGLGVSYQVFNPLIEYLQAQYHISPHKWTDSISMPRINPFHRFLQA